MYAQSEPVKAAQGKSVPGLEGPVMKFDLGHLGNVGNERNESSSKGIWRPYQLGEKEVEEREF